VALSKSLGDLVDNGRVTQWRLGEAIVYLLGNCPHASLSVATAYLNLGAFKVLERTLHKVSKLRILVGKEQEQSFVLTNKLFDEVQQALSEGKERPQEIQKWTNVLGQDFVEIRVYRKGFLHGKAYLLEGEGISPAGAVGFVGSSNFTGAGLTTNLELNAVLMQPSAVNELKNWFETLWKESDDYKQEILEMLSRFAHTYTPYEIYIKVLYEYFKDRFPEKDLKEDGKPSPIALADFQRDGYLAAKEILENYGGVLIADSVGLGKTYLAMRLLDDYAYKERLPTLIICPAALKDTLWDPLLRQYGIRADIESMERVSRGNFPIERYMNYKVIVVDESHNFRNPDTNRWSNLFKLLERDSEKKLILLTATPINNSVFDLYHQLRFITRDQEDYFLSVGIGNLRKYFERAEFNKETLYEVLEAIAVRRSRQFIRKNYPNAEIDGQPIKFPDRELHTVHYSLEKSYGQALYDKVAEAIENLNLAPYCLDMYRKEIVRTRKARHLLQLALFKGEWEREPSLKDRLVELGWDENAAQKLSWELGRQVSLAHIMRVLYLKRLESSVHALRISLGRQRDFQKRFLEVLREHGKLLDSKSYRKWIRIEDIDEQAEDVPDLIVILNSLPTLNVEEYDLEEIERAVQEDIERLDGILEDLAKITPEQDDKLNTLKRLLSSELRGKKVVVFSYFKDTARYLYRQLRGDMEFIQQAGLSPERMSIIDSDVTPEERRDRIYRFAPKANKVPVQPEREIQLLISTDVLSEGQNLQDANIIVNYDLHWNPVRIVQRIGRLDRIGSPHDTVHVYNFFPEDALERLLGLMGRLYSKLDAINRAVGLDASVLGEKPNPQDFNTIRRIAKEEPEVIDELEKESEVIVGEFIFQDLMDFLRRLGEERMQQIPLGVGTAKKGKEGVKGFFAAFRNKKTKQHFWLFELAEADKKTIIRTKLDAIKFIRSKEDESPVPLPEDFDPRPYLERLRRDIFNRHRQLVHHRPSLEGTQSQVVNWLHALPPSAKRNSLLAYFEQPLTDKALSDLRKLWRERSRWTVEKFMDKLVEFMQQHPHPSVERPPVEEVKEEDFECIAWVYVV
jgi:superfamily II DNA or RNA helicase/HKD family nuclease